MVVDIDAELERAQIKTHAVRVPIIALGTDEEWAVFVAPENCKILAVGVMTDDAITGANTDYFTLGFKNKGAAGAGTDMIASRAYTLAVDAIAFDFEDFGVITNGRLDKGDTVTFEKVETASGMATPALAAIIHYEVLDS